MHPPVYNFQPFTPDRVTRVRAEREAMWAALQALPTKKPRTKSTKPKTSKRSTKLISLDPSLTPEQAAILQALASRR